jgi:hypothetical protein
MAVTAVIFMNVFLRAGERPGTRIEVAGRVRKVSGDLSGDIDSGLAPSHALLSHDLVTKSLQGGPP